MKTCRYLGIGLANVIWGLNADAVVLDAPINEAWSIVAPLIRNQFPKGEDIITFRNLVLRPSSLGNTINNWIARSAYTADPYFAGLIDDFRVYARALSPSEITTLYATIR